MKFQHLERIITNNINKKERKMILKRKEKDGVIKAIYSSSNICASVYNNITNELTIIFNHGGQYKYTDVAKTDYMRFETADSQGSVLNTNIKKYTSSKLDNVDTTEILKEVAELKDETEVEVSPDVATKEMLQSMSDIISNYLKNGNVTTASLTGLKDKISTFEKVKNLKPEIVHE
jgi:hypothetical protein